MVRPVAKTASIPAPVGGLNDRDSVADMPPKDAVIMENWWPYPSYVGIRKGSVSHVTGFPAAVETLAEYLPANGARKLFAVSNGAIYDATSSGVVGAPMITELANSQFQHQQITTPGGSFLYLVNGIDFPQLWNGTTWQSILGTGPAPHISGTDPSKFVHVNLFKNRLFFVEANSLNVHYLPVNSITGTASLLDLGSIFRLGGYLMASYTWTLDAGNGMDDHIVFISSNGEVAVYSGTDPSSADTWALVGVFSIGRPLGRRCGVKLGGDLVINTTEGIISLSNGLLSSSIQRIGVLSDKIQNSVGLVADLYRDNFGWQVEFFPDATMLILNVPAGYGMNFQFVQNTITGAWAKFTGWDARCFISSFDGLYYGDSNSVTKAWVVSTDKGVAIQGDLLPAFSDFRAQGRNKFFTMLRPNVLTDASPSLQYGLNVNYAPQEPTGTLSSSTPSGMVWGSMVWGSMTWGGGLTALSQWQTVGDVGFSGAARLKCLNNGADVRLTSVDYLYQVGGIL